jgi:hypothetical protein
VTPPPPGRVTLTVVHDDAGRIVSLGWPAPAPRATGAGKAPGAGDVPTPAFGAAPRPGQHVAVVEVPPALARLTPLELHQRCRIERGPGGPRLAARDGPGDPTAR